MDTVSLVRGPGSEAGQVSNSSCQGPGRSFSLLEVAEAKQRILGKNHNSGVINHQVTPRPYAGSADGQFPDS